MVTASGKLPRVQLGFRRGEQDWRGEGVQGFPEALTLPSRVCEPAAVDCSGAARLRLESLVGWSVGLT